MLPGSKPQKTPLPPALSTSEEICVSASGEVASEIFAALGMPAAGIVEEVLVKDGDQVSTGQPLVRLNGKEEILARIATAEIKLADAQNVLDTLKKISATQFATSKKTLADAQKALKDAQEEH